jgi:hypothetical protein
VQSVGLAAICWAIWKLRNIVCFDHKLIKSPNELIGFAAVFMNYWAGLHTSPDAENIRAGVASLLQLAEDQPGRILCLADAMMDDPATDQMETDGFPMLKTVVVR